jgi:hypothetical protein
MTTDELVQLVTSIARGSSDLRATTKVSPTQTPEVLSEGRRLPPVQTEPRDLSREGTLSGQKG